MITVINSSNEQEFWDSRYEAHETGWDIGGPSTPIKAYIDQLNDKSISILIPGAGNAYEAAYLYENGYFNVTVLDISNYPIENFKKNYPQFPENQLIVKNFFEFEGQFDLILEQTFFCSFVPSIENRTLYAKKIAELLKPKGKLVGLWFDFPKTDDMIKRPFGGSLEEYISYFEPYFSILTFEKSYNSIKPRSGNELFGIFQKI